MWLISLRNGLGAAAIGLIALSAVPASAAPDCLCRYKGAFYQTGQCVCMRVGGVTRRACCGKVLNNTSWSFSGKSCDMVENKPRATPAPWSIAERAVKPRLRRWQDIR